MLIRQLQERTVVTGHDSVSLVPTKLAKMPFYERNGQEYRNLSLIYIQKHGCGNLEFGSAMRMYSEGPEFSPPSSDYISVFSVVCTCSW